jgi:hypothetical protein
MARPNPRLIALAAAVAVLLLAFAAAPRLLTGFVAERLHAAAARRGYEASWSRLGLRFTGLTLERLRVTRAGGDTAIAVDSLDISLRVRPLFFLQIRPARMRVVDATVHAGGAAGAEEDPLDVVPPEPPAAGGGTPRPADPGVREAADALIRLLLVPARDLPELDLTHVTLATGSADDAAGGPALHLESMRLRHLSGGERGERSSLEARGVARLQREVPFTFDLTYDRRDRVTGHARLGIPDRARGTLEPLVITLDGRFVQRRRAGTVSIDSTLLTFGEIPVRVFGLLERRGPRIHLDLAADSLTDSRWRRSVPRPVLGPLLELEIGGAWDQRLAFDLDLAQPDGVQFDADVVSRGMRIERTGALTVFGLDQPFVARIHLPKRTVERDLSERNPHFRPLGAIDSNLVHAVVTNEDGAFYRHGGFNLEAVRQSIAENARAGRFRRGAGTITMQLARNLYLGHERTLSRKWQEVALAWILEHLTPVTKERLLEIYLNIIEWGPDVHGADEATRFYFGHDASHASIDEALFLATVVPAPSRWKWRLERDGALRHGTRAQMHFIGRRMIDKGWLRPGDLPPADSLRIELLGPARDLMLPAIAAVDDPRFEPMAEDTARADTARADTVRADTTRDSAATPQVPN